MVGASEETFARMKPVLETWAGKIVHIGGPGDGHRMKLLNNFVSLGYAAIYAEALALSRKVGISPERFDSVISGGRMDCGFYQTFKRWTLEGDPDAHKFTLANAYKDLRYLASMANAAGVAGAMGDAVKNTFALAHGAGGDADFVPMLASYVAHASGVDDGLYDKLPSKAQVIACRTVLVLGGARSGKSRYALALAEAAAPESGDDRDGRGARRGDGGAHRPPSRRARRRLDDARGAARTLRRAAAGGTAGARRAGRLRDAVVVQPAAGRSATWRRRSRSSPGSRRAAGPTIFVSNEVG